MLSKKKMANQLVDPSVRLDQQGNVIPVLKKYEVPKESPAVGLPWNLYIKRFTAKDLLVPISHLVIVRASDSVRSTLWTLIRSKIQCVPVYNEQTKRYIGLVDVFDMVQYIFSNAGECLLRSDFFQGFKGHTYANEPVSTIVNLSNRDHWLTITENATLEELLDMMVSANLHRMPIMNSKQRFSGLLTQSKVVQFLAERVGGFPVAASKKISDLGLGSAENVYTIREDMPCVNAFMLMLEKGVRGLAVVNANGQLVDAITASDIKGLIYGDFFSDLRQPVVNFLPKVRILLGRNLGPIHCSNDCTVESILKKLNQEKVHRIFVVDENRIPIRVIALRDILRALLSPQIC